MSEPLLSLRGVTRTYGRGDGQVTVLHNIDLDIHPGEFVVLVGQSGSGKSTLMNIIGCLDRPTTGTYCINGRPVAQCSADALAELRRKTFGFIFQRYRLIPNLTALENTEIPAVYCGQPSAIRRDRATKLLRQLGLDERLHHRPSALSGGQQQRVSIARALMNGAQVILADEPTGALDSANGQAVLELLRELHTQGHTVIVVTHDAQVAEHGHRLVHLKDGQIIEDRLLREPHVHHGTQPLECGELHQMPLQRESLKMAWRALIGNRLRTILTLLGVVIGVSSVVAMLGVGAGIQAKTLEQYELLGAWVISVNPGAGSTGVTEAEVHSLVAADVAALAKLPGVQAVTPESTQSVVLRHGNRDVRTVALGVGSAMPETENWTLAQGAFFGAEHERRYAQVMVLGARTARALFAGAPAVGQYLIVDNSTFLVMGVMQAKGSGVDDAVWVPANTFGARLSGRNWYDHIAIKAATHHRLEAVAARVHDMLRSRHGREDFTIINPETSIKSKNSTQRTLTLALGSIAAISLLVGGIGVMNIMLVSVTERIEEIGIRMAVGARPRDVMMQFLIEAMLVSSTGGLIGLALILTFSRLVTLRFSGDEFRMIVGAGPIAMAFGSAFITGVVFGFMPARKAARLAPAEALAME